MAYTGVYVFGDSLVDSGNALKLAQWYGDLTFSDLPDGAPTSDLGYFEGRFADGYTFADLLANKAIGQVTDPVFPFGYVDPWLGIEIAPWTPEPSGNNLNFAYGGAQVRGADEAVLDLDGQTDAFKDAVDGDAPPGALYIITMGGNDVRNLAKVTSDPADPAGAFAALDKVAIQLIGEISQLITSGARHFLITGIPDVGLIPDYDIDHSGTLDATEQARADAATLFSQYLDLLIRTEVVPALEAKGATVTYVPMMDYQNGGSTVTGGLNAILPTLEALHGLAPGALTTDMLAHHQVVFFDDIHPTAQVHALFGSYAQSLLTGAPWIETLPLTGADIDYSLTASITVSGEIDQLLIALVAGTEYRFDMLGTSSLAVPGTLADPSVNLLGPGGNLVGSDADSGAGFDAVLIFNPATSGNYSLQLSATGSLTGAYTLQATVVGGAAMQAGNIYTIDRAATLVLEGAGGLGTDVVKSSVSYALATGSEIEQLTTTNAKGKTAINLTGNEFDQQIIGNAGNNILEGKGGADTLTGGAGKDVFVLGGSGIDTITDYAKGDIVDVSQLLSVAAGVNVITGGYVRVTTTGLVQVDVNGGGDQWVTLSNINGNGAVAIRYVSGGTPSTVSVSRVTADTTSFMLASVAAATGLAFVADPSTVESNGTTVNALAGVSLGKLDAGGEFGIGHAWSPLAGEFIDGAWHETGSWPHVADLSTFADSTGDLAKSNEPAGPVAPMIAGTELTVSPMPSFAEMLQTAPFPMLQSAAAGAIETYPIGNVAQIIADVLSASDGPASIDTLLNALPADGHQLGHSFPTGHPGHELIESLSAYEPAMLAFGADEMAVQLDTVAMI